MIFLQVISALVLVFIVVIMYLVAIKLVQEHRELHNKNTDQDNLDLTNKQ